MNNSKSTNLLIDNIYELTAPKGNSELSRYELIRIKSEICVLFPFDSVVDLKGLSEYALKTIIAELTKEKK